MRILFLSDNFPPETNAAAIRVFERARRWARAGHAVTVITSAPNFPAGRVYPGYRNRWRQWEQMEGVDVLRVKSYMAPNRGVLRRTLDLVSFAITSSIAGAFVQRPDVVAATSPQFFCGLAGALVARLRRRPFVLELGDLWPASVVAVGAMRRGVRIRLAEWLEQRLYKRAQRIVTLTDAFRAELLANRNVPAEKVRVVYNGIDAEAIRPRGTTPAVDFGFEPRLTVSYIGNHGMAHRLDVALDAAERLAEDGIAFLFVGDGAERERLEAEAERRGLANVRFMGSVPRERIGDYWRMTDVALVQLRNAPVLATVLPSKLLEAAVAGKPVVLSAPEGEATALLEREGFGVRVPPQDAEALARAIRQLAADFEGRQRYAAAARTAVAHFDAADSAARVLAVLEEVASPQRCDAVPAEGEPREHVEP